MKAFWIAGAAATLALAAVAAGCGGRDDGSADYARGMAAYEAEDWQTAVEAFDRSARTSGTNAAAFFHLAAAHFELGNPKAADLAVKSAMDLAPGSPEIILLDGEVAYLLKDYDRAARDWNLVAGDPAVPAAVRSGAFSRIGALAIVRNEPERARLALWRGLKVDRSNPQVWYHLGKLHRDVYRFDREALSDFEMFVRLAPAGDEQVARVKERTIPDLRTAVAADAAELASLAPRRNAGAAAAAIAAGDKLASAKKFTLALKQYEKALKEDPLSSPAALRAAETTERLNTAADGLAKVLAAWKRAAELPPYPKAAYHGAARVAQRMSHWSESQAILARALSHNPADVAALDMLITAYRKTGKAKLADEYTAYRKSISAK